MRKSIFKKKLILILFTIISLEANELFFLNLKNKIDNDISLKLDDRFEKYNYDINQNKKVLVDTLYFSSLVEKNEFHFDENNIKNLKVELEK